MQSHGASGNASRSLKSARDRTEKHPFQQLRRLDLTSNRSWALPPPVGFEFEEHPDMHGGPRRGIARAVWFLVAILTFALIWSLLLGDFSDARVKIHGYASAVTGGEDYIYSPPTNGDQVGRLNDAEFWRNLEYTFTFGDSYTSTWFDPDEDPQPSPDNPFGNRARLHPEKKYDGPKWLESLTTKYNTSSIINYNMAVGGATIARDIVASPYTPFTFNEQLEQHYLKWYATAGQDKAPDWKPSNTLFAFFFGINDSNVMYLIKRRIPVAQLVERYHKYLETIFLTGARAFLILTVPPIDMLHADLVGTAEQHEDIMAYNKALFQMVEEFAERHREEIRGRAWVLDTYQLWMDAIKSPKRFPETKHLKETKTFCPAYIWGTGEMDTYNEACPYRKSEYFWENDLHAMWPAHMLTAATIVRDCFGDTVKGYCH